MYSLTTCLNFRVFSEQSHRTTHKTTLSVISASCFVPGAPRGLFYHGPDKGFRALSGIRALGEHICAYCSSLRAWYSLPLRAISEPFVALNACLQFSCSFVYIFFCVAKFARNMLPLSLFEAIFDRTPSNICSNAVSLYFCAIFCFVSNGP